MATREELIEYRVSTKGETRDVAIQKVDAYLAKKGGAPESVKVETKTTPGKGAGKKPSEGPKSPGGVTAPPPPPPKNTPPPGAKVYGAEPPDKYRDYGDTTPPVTIRKPEPEVSLMGRGGLWLDREAAAKAQAKDRAREAARVRAEGPMMVEETRIYADIPKAMRYSDVGDLRRSESNVNEVAGMRAALRRHPTVIKTGMSVDEVPDEDVRETYRELFMSGG